VRLRAAIGAFLLWLSGSPAAAALPFEQVVFSATCDVEGAPSGSRCGTLRVLEDRSRAAGRQLALRFVIVPGEGRAPDDPLVYLAGGPGESAFDAVPVVLPTLRSVENDRQVVFLEQRGTGGSSSLQCPAGLDLIRAISDAPAVRQCAAALRTKADLNHYTSSDAAADLEDLRAAMRYRQINLVAVSYGVRVALLYMRQHPRRVRTAVLRAAYPLDYNIISAGAHAADAQLALVIDECTRDPACRQAYPGLPDQLLALDRQLAAAPATSATGEARSGGGQATVTRDLFHYLLLAMMQASVSRQYIPMVIATAASRGLQPFSSQLAQLQTSLKRFPVGLYLSVLCSEDAPRQHDYRPARTPLATAAQKLLAACSNWPVRPASDRALEPFTSDVPTLIVSGALDPVTPAESAERLAGSLPNSRHLIIPATGHGPMFPECMRPGVTGFIRTSVIPSSLDACSALTLPAFAVPAVEVPAQAPQSEPAVQLSGTWDLQWQTRRGPSPGGYLVISQNGRELTAQLHGRGSIQASGSIEGNGFILRGSRLFVPYTLTGTMSADRIEGTLKVMSVERQFTGQRRTTPSGAAGS